MFQAYICFAAGNIIGDGYKIDERLIDNLEALYEKSRMKHNYLYVVSGGQDTESQPFITKNIEDFNSILSKFNSQNIHIKAEIIEGEGHTDVILPGLINAFEFIFPKKKWMIDYLELIEKEGSAKENILAFYKKLSDEYGFETYPNTDRLYSMNCLKNVGRRLARKEPKEAIEIFQYWTELYPTSHLANYYLGIAFRENKQTNKAKEYLEKAYNFAVSENSNSSKKYKAAIKQLKN